MSGEVGRGELIRGAMALVPFVLFGVAESIAVLG